ncbi:MAG: hypothetical protein ACKN9E_15920 [Microcystaceae cyanobacterium]
MADQNLPESFPRKLFLPLHDPDDDEFVLENLVLNANLQELGQKIFDWCDLETDGKMTPTEAYEQICQLCQQHKLSKDESPDS